MTPPDQNDEQPSALSRLERALAGFGEPSRTAEPEAPAAAVAEAVDEPDEAEVPEPEAYELPPLVDEDDEVEEDDDDFEDATIESSPVLNIASAVDAIERLAAARDAEDSAASLSDADEFVLATTAARADDFPEPDELPRFEPADLRARIKEFENEDAAEPVSEAVEEDSAEPDPIEEDDGALPTFVAEETAPARPDAAASWERNLGDTTLPYFLVEDNRPAVVGPEALGTVPTLEELRQAPVAEVEKPQASVARTLAEIPILLIVAALIAFLVKTFLAQAYYIPSGSMLPQLQIDDRVVVSKLAYKVHDPRRGDIVVFDDPRTGADAAKADEGFLRKVGEGIGIVQPSTDEFIKRVIGLPGETVEGRDGHVFVNGHRLYEPYLQPSVVTSDFPKTTVKAGHLWVMGDNRAGSADSRVFGQIDIDTIVGRAVVTVWPFGNAQFL